jgi:hypothetical protein
MRYRPCIYRATSRGRVSNPLLDFSFFFDFILPHRTGKRDLGGLLNDGINSLARFLTFWSPFAFPLLILNLKDVYFDI